jgi:hypothetical protein
MTVGMNKIEKVSLTPGGRELHLLLDCIPPHVGHLMLLIGLEFHYLSSDQAQTFLEAEFFTLEKGFEARDRCQDRASFFDGSEEGFDQSKLLQIFHAVLEGPYSRKNNTEALNLFFIPVTLAFEANPFEPF